jgi:hypothetical protein
MIRMHTVFLAVILTTGLAGCETAHTLSNLNASYSTLLARQAAADPKLDVIAKDEILLGFATVAMDADTLAKEAKDPATRIVAWRLAAVAAWQARERGGKELYDNAHAAGMRECDSLPTGRLGAPRDCAILTYLPILRGYEALVFSLKDYERISGAGQQLALLESTTAGQQALSNAISQLMPKVNSKQNGYAGASPEILDYLNAQSVRVACVAENSSQKSRDIRDSNATLKERADVVKGKFDKMIEAYDKPFKDLGIAQNTAT